MTIIVPEGKGGVEGLSDVRAQGCTGSGLNHSPSQRASIVKVQYAD